jgi:hypothetical protein
VRILVTSKQCAESIAVDGFEGWRATREQSTAESGALGEAVAFLHHFRDMPDHQQAGNVVYPLADGFTDIARFGAKKIDLLRRFRPFVDGAPPHDTLGDIFATLDAGVFQRCFVNWVAALIHTPAEVIAIDGKTLRRSYQKKGAKDPIHRVWAFAARQRLVLGQVKVNEKSNEHETTQ